jgi:hypothetical protein
MAPAGARPARAWIHKPVGKIPILASVLEHVDFKGKPSTRWTPESVHD